MSNHRRPQPQSDPALVRFARVYGWRAYAIPVLAVVTVFLIMSILRTPEDEMVGAHTSEAQPTSLQAPRQLPEGDVAPTQLPPGAEFAQQGDGTYRTVGQPGATVGEGKENTVRYVVEIENGVNTTGYGGDEAFAAMVDAVLADPRGWTNDPRFRFEHVAPDQDPTLRIQLTSVGTTREKCGADIEIETSCRLLDQETEQDRVLINESRWVRGAVPFQGDLGQYRQYMVNHEVGHALGFADHVPCGGPNQLAPIMMQQTLSMSNAELRKFSNESVYPDNTDTCRPNPWPYPRPSST
ncbi:DUF3152 domain-containing protein [Corynebacterium aquatimens]|uniref:DUF3152 domain-containing protein n=1 Tax=Corynebacterium aquatimens TaxID=1190508 RepID=A0A931E4Y9_9CORY|nr:DUF3152 domain-containing protein [Corynebacterium aquatimens]MBG6123176.1 hypothetical protein [Corynebacterium aquatimens]WJY66493.1 hypothetical protein CAQUA_09030 [Corynebacterium aquatimens]